MRLLLVCWFFLFSVGHLLAQSAQELKHLREMEAIFNDAFLDEAMDVKGILKEIRGQYKSSLEKDYLEILLFEYGVGDLAQGNDSVYQQLKRKKAKWSNPYLLTRFAIAAGYYFHTKGECALERNATEEVKVQMERIQESDLKQQYFFFYCQLRANTAVCDGKMDEALDALKEFEADKRPKALEEKFFLARETGFIHIQLGSPERAKHYYREYLSLLKPLSKKAPDKTGQAYNGMAAACYRLDQLDSTLYYAKLAKASFSRGKNTDSKLIFWNNYTTLLLRLDKKEEALAVALEGLAMLQKKDMKYEPKTLRSIGSCYLALGNAPMAESYVKRALESARKHGDPEELIRSLDNIATFEFEQGRPSQAYTYLLERMEISEALADSLGQGRMQLYLVEYETYKKERDLQQAKKDQSILALENEKQGILIVLIVIIAFVLVGILIAYLYFSKRITRYKMENERMKLARAQVNPHFLNNAFTTIQTLVFTPDSEEKVLDFTAHVARFSRLMLESSIQDAWSLKHELEMLTHYADIFVQKFPGKYTYTLSGTLDAGLQQQINVPTAILQPVIENAFEYAGGAAEPRIEITLSQQENVLLIEIRNNRGDISLAQKRAAHEPSRGSHIVKERIALFNKRSKHTIDYQLELNEREASSRFTITL